MLITVEGNGLKKIFWIGPSLDDLNYNLGHRLEHVHHLHVELHGSAVFHGTPPNICIGAAESGSFQ